MNNFKNFNPRCGAKAVTFIEILIALSILALAIMPSMNVFTSFKKYTLYTEDIQFALRLAQEKLEEYKAVSYSELKNLIKSGKKQPESNIQVTEQKNSANIAYTDYRYKRFKRQTTLSFLNNDEDMVLVTVYVWWYEGNFSAGDQRFVSLKSLVCKDMVL